LRRLLPTLQTPRFSDAQAGPNCAVALLLVLPLAGQLPLAGHGSKPLAAGAGSNTLKTVSVTAPAAAAPLQAIRAQHQSYALTPERRALLNTIRYAEGTWRGGSSDGYRMIYGGGLFNGFSRHPDIVVVGNYVSAAAGAYQFLPTTWKATARELGLSDFSPASQDQAALHLVQRRGALRQFDREGLSHGVLARLAPEWASLPTQDGGSYYGQPVHSAAALRDFYQQDLQRQRRIEAERPPADLAIAQATI
jgi:lysozyme